MSVQNNSLELTKKQKQITYTLKDSSIKKQIEHIQNTDPLSINYRSIMIKPVDYACVSSEQKTYLQRQKFDSLNYFDFSKYLTLGNDQKFHSDVSLDNRSQIIKNIPEKSIQILKKKVIRKNRIRKKTKEKSSSSDEYIPRQSDESQEYIRQFPQTKNIIKNFGNAIYTFILNQKLSKTKLLQLENVDSDNFFKNLESFKDSLATIYGLRSFWSDQENPYARQIRILSSIFLRKYCLKHIFNSRIQNYHRNIKYRYKMMKSLANPSKFTQVKQY